eukprot:189087-Chlamydomonas_euryale.AAC.2
MEHRRGHAWEVGCVESEIGGKWDVWEVRFVGRGSPRSHVRTHKCTHRCTHKYTCTHTSAHAYTQVRMRTHKRACTRGLAPALHARTRVHEAGGASQCAPTFSPRTSTISPRTSTFSPRAPSFSTCTSTFSPRAPTFSPRAPTFPRAHPLHASPPSKQESYFQGLRRSVEACERAATPRCTPSCAL